MDQEERTHNESLLQIYTAHLRQLEIRAAKYGALAVPSHITLEIEENRRKIAELESRLRTPAPARTPGPRHNLPPRDYERFVGRQKELVEVRRLLGPKSRAFVVTIDGIGGIGKSALALETAYSFVDQYTDVLADERFEAIVWISAKRTYLTAGGIRERRQVFRTLGDVFAAVARVLDYPAITRARAEEQRAIVEQALREQRTLLLFDNLETVDDEDLLDFLHELPEPTKALITTRYRIDVARPVRLTGMEHHDALALIGQEAARKSVALTADEQEQLWQRTGGVPLAIVWSIGLMGLGGSAESVLRRLGSGQSDIAHFCFAESVAQIRGRDAYWLLLALSLFTADASREALGMVAGLGEDTFGCDMGLELLLRLSLVNKEGERFSVLPLTRSFMRGEAAANVAWIDEARGRLQKYFYELATTFGASSQWGEQDHVERDLDNISSVINSLIATLRYQTLENDQKHIDPLSIPQANLIIDFMRPVIRTCRIRGYWSDFEEMCRIVVNIGREISATAEVGWRCYDLSRLYFARSNMEAANRWAIEAREEGYRSGDLNIVRFANRQIGLVALNTGDIDGANIYLSKAVTDYKQTGETKYLPPFMESMGDLSMQQGDFSTAIFWYQSAIDIHRQSNDIDYLAVELACLGQAKLATGDIERAYSCYEESLKLARECRRVDVIARALLGLAVVGDTRKQPESTISYARQALDLFRRLGMKREQAEAEALLARLGGMDGV